MKKLTKKTMKENMKKCRGFTLPEMLVSISVGSVLMGLALGMVHRTMRAESTSRTHAQIERTAARLSRQFRHDIHQSQSVSLDNQPAKAPSLKLVLPDQPPISYQIEKGFVLREQLLGNGKTHREIFSFPEDHLIQFAELAEPARAVLSLDFDTKLVGIPPQARLRVEAVLGLFLRPSLTEEASP